MGDKGSQADQSVIDCFVQHDWSDKSELFEYLPRGWQEYAGQSFVGAGKAAIVHQPYRNPDGDTLASSSVAGFPGPTGLVDPFAAVGGREIGAAVLSYGSGRLIPADDNPHLSVALCRAANEWTVDRWLSRAHDRLWGSILAPNHLPDEAATEIVRAGKHPRMVQVLMTGNGLGKPFGHPLYHPIYAAAASLGLPVALHAGGDAPTDTLTQTAAIGPPGTYTEFKILAAQPLMTHLLSLICQGLFDKYPELQVLFVGAGVGWILPTIWRADMLYESFGGRATPWMKRKPSEYLVRNIRFATYQANASLSKEMAVLLEAIDGFEDILCYGSGYPASDSIQSEQLAKALTWPQARKVLHDNALRLYAARMTGESVPVEAGRELP
jgi:predicted TIM-barrel fold metal-dependent hydrolase